MKSIYLVKKNPAADGSDNWTIMNKKEFDTFIKSPEGKKRQGRFGKLEAVESDDTIIFIECSEEDVRSMDLYAKQAKYRRERKAADSWCVFSYDQLQDEEGDISGEDLITGEELSVEDIVCGNIAMEILHQALSELDTREYEIIHAFYLSQESMTEEAYGRMNGMTRDEVHALKRRACRKLKEILENNPKFFCPF